MLSSDQFPAFVQEVHGGRSPFPWQVALLNRVVHEGQWPDVIDVPTGLGKTSIVDIAVFAAALGVTAARRRVFYVVDRRLVVDEAYEHARRIASAFDEPGGRPVTTEVARRLRMPGDAGSPLDVTRMRGGTTWDRVWLDRPDRFAIVTGTVDQVGSRLLFRGYGVSERARSIDAALVGTDSLIIVDEAHLSRPFVTTATAALAVDQATVTRPPIVVTMSATSGADDATRVHRITADDEAHPIAGSRLRASKRLHLVEVKTTKAKAEREVPAALAALAVALSPERVVGVVVNTVARARAVFSLLKQDKHDAILLTGRTRDIDRDYLLSGHYPRLRVDRDRTDRTPLIVVATQTVEVGANIDVDALVTESAPLASLVQRLGRLNRLGTASSPAIGVVVHDTTVADEDPVYGPARNATWAWLSRHTPARPYAARSHPWDQDGGMDAGPAALRTLFGQAAPGEAAAMRAAEPYVPVLDSSIVDAWVRTSPAPVPDQPIEPFLHGLRESPLPVTVVWRDGLHGDATRWAEQLDIVPPAAEEGIDVPVHAVRQWLLYGRADDTASDLDTAATNSRAGDARDDDAAGQPLAVARVVRYRGRGDAEPIPPSRIRPGDTIVVPVQVGGCDRYGWDPRSTTPAVDVADLALRHGRPVLRLGPTLVSAVHTYDDAFDDLVDQLVRQSVADLDEDSHRDPAQLYVGILRQVDQHLSDTPFARAVHTLLRRGLRTIVATTDRADDERDASRPVLLTVQAGRLADDDTSLGSSATAVQIGLDAHQRAVAELAAEVAGNLGLPPAVVASIRDAARWHDEGKRDPRFQVMLWAGDRAAADIAEEPLAKSAIASTDRAAFVRARRAAGYPAGLRHEALSARIAVARLAATDTDDVDPDLVVHLVASHHGRARPLMAAVADPAPVKVELDTGDVITTAEPVDPDQPSRFQRLNARYGRWGLALCETVVRLADIWCSVHNKQSTQDGPVTLRRTGHITARPRRYDLTLPALDGRDALGFLAALGLLRVLTDDADHDIALSFSDITAHAILHSPYETTEAVAAALTAIVGRMPADSVIPDVPAGYPLAKVGTTGGDPMRAPRAQHRDTIDAIRAIGGDPALRWHTHLVTDLARDEKERVALTQFMAPVGQQTVKSFFQKTIEKVREDPAFLHQALAGWQRVADYTGEYLDHRVLRSAADHPRGESSEIGVPGATWLATMALPILRVTGDGKDVTSTLWRRPPGQPPAMLWPLWRQPLDLAATIALIEHPSIDVDPAKRGRDDPGIVVDRTAWPALGIFSMAAARRQPMEGRKSAGVLAPIRVSTT